jgi:pyruvate,water dikinase
MLTQQSADLFLTLDDITAADRPRVGGKAYNCARMRQAGFPVPDGVVVPADAADEEIPAFLECAWLAGVPRDVRFAVRSSGIAEDSDGDSFAGIHESFLNVERRGLAAAIRDCRRSAQSDQARAYRAARHLEDERASIGVFVQRMVPAVKSGVTFTVNPVNGADELVIESVDGLGEALVSGRVEPEEQRLSKSDGSPLARLAVGIEQLYGAPQDIEWCFDGRQYWVVQSRPVTVRPFVARRLQPPRSAGAEAPALPGEPVPAGADIMWTRANLAEVLPDQLSPQALDVYGDLLNGGQSAFFGRLLAPESELGPIVKAFHGRLYLNLSQLRHISMMAGASFADMLRSLGHAEHIRPEDEIKVKPPVGAFVRALPDIARLAITTLRLKRVFLDHQALVTSMLERLAADPSKVSDGELAATIEWWIAIGTHSIPTVLAMSNVQPREQFISRACERVGLRYEELAYPYLAAGERSVSSRQAFDLVALADAARVEPRARDYLLAADDNFESFRAGLAGTAFLARFERFIATYGHRGRYESDWSIPRMHEEPAAVLFAIRERLDAPPQDANAVAARQEAAAAAAWQAFESRLTVWQRLTLAPMVRAALRQLKQQYVWRERVRFELTRVVSAIRRWHLALADRFVERGWLDRRDDYFMLLVREVTAVCTMPEFADTLRGTAARRAARLAAERDLRLPLFMHESELPALLNGPAAPAAAGDELRGLCVSPGAVEAEVVVLRDPAEFASMKRGAILVAPATDPSWTPLFTLASGVIVEVGGMLSHASTIAREYGLPALANVKGATSVLRTGDRLWLDASGGRAVRR